MCNAYTTRMVLVKPEPCFQPVTIITVSPVEINPRAFPNRIPNCTRSSTSFIQSLWVGAIMQCYFTLSYSFTTTQQENNINGTHRHTIVARFRDTSDIVLLFVDIW